jgi:hypothetical protein
MAINRTLRSPNKTRAAPFSGYEKIAGSKNIDEFTSISGTKGTHDTKGRIKQKSLSI